MPDRNITKVSQKQYSTHTMSFVAVAIKNNIQKPYASCYANLVRSEDAHVNPEMNGMVTIQPHVT